MSHKKAFIQRAVTHFLPWLDWNMDKALAYAERAWDRLSERGYGSAKTQGPRPMADHYRALTDTQRQWFDRFWKSYDHKKGKQRAAMRWGQLGELDEATYQQIIRAAEHEAQRPLAPGQVRKMAEGWLTERRWEDHATTNDSPEDEYDQQLRQLSAELAHARRLADMGDEYWAGEVNKLETQLNALRGDV
jgi:hypothetical protein